MHYCYIDTFKSYYDLITTDSRNHLRIEPH